MHCSGKGLTSAVTGFSDLRLHTMKPIPHLLTAALVLAGSHVWADNKATEADNTAKNERDQSGETKTPIDQSQDAGDIELTAKIRQMVVKDDALSMLAKNAKIISENGTVVLRGPVESETEKKTIAEYARTAGAKKVVNEIEVK